MDWKKVAILLLIFCFGMIGTLSTKLGFYESVDPVYVCRYQDKSIVAFVHNDSLIECVTNPGLNNSTITVLYKCGKPVVIIQGRKVFEVKHWKVLVEKLAEGRRRYA